MLEGRRVRTGGPKISMPELQNMQIQTYRYTCTEGIQLRQRHKAQRNHDTDKDWDYKETGH